MLGNADVATAPKPKIDTPRISCAGATPTSINIQVCGGATTGLPAGFSLQWAKLPDFQANNGQWSDGSDLFCSAGFSGNANLSRYNLAPGECVTINVGDFLFDNGASTDRADCANPLECGTQYVLRAFGHATSTQTRSDWTTTLTCATLDCGHAQSCTLTQGYCCGASFVGAQRKYASSGEPTWRFTNALSACRDSR